MPTQPAASAATSSPETPSTSPAREALTALFEARFAGDSPHALAERFDEDVDWLIQGDTAAVPWIGRKVGRTGAAEHFAQLGTSVDVEAFELDTILADGNRAVALGAFRATAVATGRPMGGDFAFDITVDENGLITRFHMLEDSWAVSEAVRP